MTIPVDRPDDEHLRALLAVESRLQAMVRAAREAANRKVAEATAAGQQRRAMAIRAAETLDVEQARSDALEHERSLEVLAAEHRAALAAIDGIPESRLAALVDWTLGRLLDEREGSL
jgi:vacuolar-type H+-ATPase subunit H